MTLCRLNNRSVIRIGGEDRRPFLQGLISNDINLCQPEKPIYAALLTPQGKFLHDMFLVDEGGYFLVDCEAARADDLLKRLKAHKLRAKATFDAAPEFEVWSEWATDLHGAPEWYADPRLPALGWRAMLKKEGINPEASFDVYDRHRLSFGVPDGSRDMIVEKSTLLECNIDQLNGINWTKGCYMGQELTARMHYRALVKKRLFPVKIEGTAPAPGSIIQSDGVDVGEMRSSCGDAGLALLNIEKANTPLTCGEAKLKAVKPEWLKI